MIKRLLSILFLLCVTLPSFAAHVTLSGKAPDYAGLNIVVYTYADYVSRLKTELATFTVEDDGAFSAQIEIDEVTYAFMDLSAYEATVYLEPGARYEVVLPPFKVRPDAERFNPFYRAQSVELGLRGATTNLNQAIRDFDIFFGRIYSQNALKLVRRHDTKLADKLIARTDSAARAVRCDKAFFRNHVRYRQAQLFAAPRLHAERTVLSKYYVGSPVLFNLPAYWQTLEMLNPDIIEQILKPDERRKLRSEVASTNPSIGRISQIIATDTLWRADQTLREALIIKSIFTDFYDANITDGRADTLLISAAQSCKSKRNRLMAANIYAKKNKLRAGLPAPELDLVDEEDKTLKLKDFSGKFLYLCFMHTENYECIKALPALENLALLHKNDMDVLCVFTDENADEMRAFLKRTPSTWRGVSFNTNQKILSDYEVHALPTYFLIAPDGCIAMAQAPGPTEKVGPVIAHAIREYTIATKRGRPEIPRTIYDIANEAR